MNSFNIDPLIVKARDIVDTHCLRTGAYCRWLKQNDTNTRKMGVNEYGIRSGRRITFRGCARTPIRKPAWVLKTAAATRRLRIS